MERVIAYTDGSCEPNPGPGGWGALLIFPTYDLEHSGGELATTNNRMEMQAAIGALKALDRRSSIVVHSDSQYLTRGMSEWMPKWLRNGLPEKNRDLWTELNRLCREHEVEWVWVRGHSGVEGNERADALARRGWADLMGMPR